MSAVLGSKSPPTLGLGWGLLGLAALVLLLVFRETAAAMENTWRNSSTFAHAYLVPVISGWLIWRSRARLTGLPQRSVPMLLVPVAIACGAWLMGQLAGVNALSQFALVTLLVLLVPLLLGRAIARVLAFPLLYLYFAVPFGTFLVPLFIDWTADFTVYALRASGVPVFREGTQFIVPTGSWSVVEACSGVRYLIAAVMVGALFAYLNYQSLHRRLVFMGVAVVVPIVANWLRAYMIVMIGHHSNNKLAVGVDHILYGWVFFGIVVALMFWVGSRWADVAAPAASQARATGSAGDADERDPLALWCALGLVVLLLATQAAASRLEPPATRAKPSMQLPDRLGAGWSTAPKSALQTWSPAFGGARATDNKIYGSGTAEVGVWAGLYRDQSGRERMVTSSNALVEADSTQWAVAGTESVGLVVDGRPLVVRSSRLRASPSPDAPSAQRLVVWQTYWVGGQWIASDARAKLALGLERLQGRGDDSVAVMLYARPSGGEAADIAATEAILHRFANENLARLARDFDSAARSAPMPARN